MVTEENEKLIREYLDIVANAPEDLTRVLKILTDDCTWRITPPGIEFRGTEQLRPFIKRAMGSRTHTIGRTIEVRNWFADGDHFCLEYFHAALATRFHIKTVENVCLVCRMRDGKFDRIHEYVDASGSLLISIGLKILPLISGGTRVRPKTEAAE